MLNIYAFLVCVPTFFKLLLEFSVFVSASLILLEFHPRSDRGRDQYYKVRESAIQYPFPVS